MLGLRNVNADLVGFVLVHARHKQATLDMDATLIETHKEQALYCYKKRKAYQPFTTYWAEADLEMTARGWYKVFRVVTNRDLDPEELVWWSRQRCGKGEEAHSVLKEDLAGGRLPSGLFGANAAWWAITALAFNLNSAMKQLALGKEWARKRLKTVRFGVISLPGRVARHARTLIINLSQGHSSYGLLCQARQRILRLAHGPPGA